MKFDEISTRGCNKTEHTSERGRSDILDKLNRRPHTDNLLEKAVINPASFVIPIELISPGTWTINKGLRATFVILKDCDLIQ